VANYHSQDGIIWTWAAAYAVNRCLQKKHRVGKSVLSAIVVLSTGDKREWKNLDAIDDYLMSHGVSLSRVPLKYLLRCLVSSSLIKKDNMHNRRNPSPYILLPVRSYYDQGAFWGGCIFFRITQSGIQIGYRGIDIVMRLAMGASVSTCYRSTKAISAAILGRPSSSTTLTQVMNLLEEIGAVQRHGKGSRVWTIIFATKKRAPFLCSR